MSDPTVEKTTSPFLSHESDGDSEGGRITVNPPPPTRRRAVINFLWHALTLVTLGQRFLDPSQEERERNWHRLERIIVESRWQFQRRFITTATRILLKRMMEGMRFQFPNGLRGWISSINNGTHATYVHSSTTWERLSTCLTINAEQTIKEWALTKKDYSLLGMIDGVDLRAKEAKYHESCRQGYVKRQAEGTEQCDSESSSMSVKAAYNQAFQHICCYVQTKIIQADHVERMTMLHSRYLQFMSDIRKTSSKSARCRLSSSVHKPSCARQVSYGRCFIPGTIRVNLCCTRSNKTLSLT